MVLPVCDGEADSDPEGSDQGSPKSPVGPLSLLPFSAGGRKGSRNDLLVKGGT